MSRCRYCWGPIPAGASWWCRPRAYCCDEHAAASHRHDDANYQARRRAVERILRRPKATA